MQDGTQVSIAGKTKGEISHTFRSRGIEYESKSPDTKRVCDDNLHLNIWKEEKVSTLRDGGNNLGNRSLSAI